MNEATVLMWYDNSVLMTFLGVIVGGFIGFVGSIIQSRIAAKNNIDVVKAQGENEIEQHRYMEKEKLYSELIGFIPQFSYAVDVPANRFSLSREQRVQLNSFKARLAIFANQQIYDEFYELIMFITKEADSSKVVARMDAFTDMLLEDLKQTGRQDKTKKEKKGSGA